MAKNKHSAALFEVIGKGKGVRPEPRKGALSTPKWWYKSPKSADPSSTPVDTKVAPVALEPTQPASAASTDHDAAVPVQHKPEVRARPPEARTLGPMTALPRHVLAGTDSANAAKATSEPASSEPTPGGDPEKVRLDPDRQEIQFRLSYASSIVIAFAVLTAVVLAVIVGRQWGKGWTTTDLQASTSELLQGPANPSVLKASPGQGSTDFIDTGIASSDPLQAPRTPQTADGTALPASSRSDPSASVAAPSTPAVTGGKVPRVIGINYFIIQSYPSEADAREVVEVLARNGVPTTIERNLPGYPKWHIVVSAQGFTSMRAPEAEALRKQIDQVSADQARNDRRWKPLTPQGYRWR